MSAPQKFRAAFNGFNREDVVHYLEYINSKHTAEINQLTSEADFLRAKLESAQPDPEKDSIIAALEQERDELRASLEELQARFDALQQSGTTPAATAIPVYGTAEELEIYRRAERTERMARERADLIQRQASGVISEASVRINDAAAQITPVADQLLTQLSLLQASISSGRQSLQEAAIILSTLRSDNN